MPDSRGTHSPACGGKAASRGAVMSLAVSSGSSRPAAGSSARGGQRGWGGGEEAGCGVGAEPAGGGVLGRGGHEAVGGGDQPLLRQVAAEGSGALSLFDEALHAAQDPVVD